MDNVYLTSSVKEREEMVLFLEKQGFKISNAAMEDLNNPLDFDNYPCVTLDESENIIRVRRIINEDKYVTKQEFFRHLTKSSFKLERLKFI